MQRQLVTFLICSCIKFASTKTCESYRPMLNITPRYGEECDEITLTCNTTCIGQAVLIWKHSSATTDEKEIGYGCDFSNAQFLSNEDLIICKCNGTVPPETENGKYCIGEEDSSLSLELKFYLSKAKYIGTWKCDNSGDRSEVELIQKKLTGRPFLQSPRKEFEMDEIEVFNCTATDGVPEGTIAWYIASEADEENITCHSKTSRDDGNVTSTLTYQLKKEDNGKALYCRITQHLIDTETSDSDQLQLNVTYGPVVEMAPCKDDHIVEENHNTTLECKVKDANPSITSYKWYTDDILQEEGTEAYKISAAGQNDEATYKCSAYNGIHVGQNNATVEVIIHYAAEITDPQNGTIANAVEQTSFTYNCNAHAKPKADILWIYPNKTKTEGPVLRIDSTEISHDGTYTCRATNKIKACDKDSVTRTSNVSIHLNVQYTPKGSPTIDYDMSVIPVEKPCSMICHVDSLTYPGNPEPEFFIWQKAEEVIKNITESEWQFISSSVDDSGEYTCKVANFLGSSKMSLPVNITVEAKGTIEAHNSSKPNPIYGQKDSDELLFTCIISANHIPEGMEWKKDGTPIHENDFVIHEHERLDGSFTYDLKRAYKYTMSWMASEKDLTCSNVDEYYSGQYRCHATVQVAGETEVVSSSPVNITTHYAAMLNRDSISFVDFGELNFRLNCTVCATPAPEYYRWFSKGNLIKEGCEDFYEFDSVNDTDFGVYFCEITNAVGIKNYTLTLNESGPARAPNLEVEPNITSTSITLSWFEAYNGGHPPLTYRIEISNTNCSNSTGGYQSVGNVSGPAEANTKQYTYTVEQLQESSRYHFCVQASNSWDGGDPRSDYDCVCNQFTRESPQVVLKRAEVKSSSVLRVEWSYANSFEKSAIQKDNYAVTVRVAYRKSGENEDTIYPDKQTSAINATEESSDVLGSFSTNHPYEVYLLVFENGNQINSFESNREKTPTSPELSGGGITGIVVAVLVAIALIVLAVGFVYRRRNKLSGKDGVCIRLVTHFEGSCLSFKSLFSISNILNYFRDTSDKTNECKALHLLNYTSYSLAISDGDQFTMTDTGKNEGSRLDGDGGLTEDPYEEIHDEAIDSPIEYEKLTGKTVYQNVATAKKDHMYAELQKTDTDYYNCTILPSAPKIIGNTEDTAYEHLP